MDPETDFGRGTFLNLGDDDLILIFFLLTEVNRCIFSRTLFLISLGWGRNVLEFPPWIRHCLRFVPIHFYLEEEERRRYYFHVFFQNKCNALKNFKRRTLTNTYNIYSNIEIHVKFFVPSIIPLDSHRTLILSCDINTKRNLNCFLYSPLQ